jgi:hypothetical protein
MLRATLTAALALAITAGSAHAEIIVKRFDFPGVANYEFMFGCFCDDDGPITGQIISTTMVINYTTTGAQDAAEFYYTFDVPVINSQESHIGLTGADLGWSGQGEFHYSFENSDLYNGDIREGRFATEMAGGGAFTDSYVEFTVDADLRDPIFHDGFEPTE